MNSLLAGLVILNGIVLVSQMEPRSTQADGGDPQQGRAIYEQHCQLCHGLRGKGDGEFGRVTNPPAADFTSARSKQKPDAVLLATIQNGRPPTAMEGWKGQLSDGQIQDVLAYVKSLRE